MPWSDPADGFDGFDGESLGIAAGRPGGSVPLCSGDRRADVVLPGQ